MGGRPGSEPATGKSKHPKGLTNMTIKTKILIMGALTALVFVILSFMNTWTHQQVMSNLHVRDSVNTQLTAIQGYVKWKNEFVRLISNMAASEQVPVFAQDQFKAPSNAMIEEGNLLIKTAQTLKNRIQRKTDAVQETEQTFTRIRTKINHIYTRLDKEISTALALAQLDQVLGIDASEKSSLAPYVLKNLNQLTLTGLNALVSRKNFTIEQKGMVEKNLKFIQTQIHIIDTDKKIQPLLESLFEQLDLLDQFITDSGQVLTRIDQQIAQADFEFQKAAQITTIDYKVAEVRSRVDQANHKLESASRINFAITSVLMIIVPIVIVIAGLIGLNRLIIRPISRLANMMNDVEKGNFDVTAQVLAQDEIGNLARAFNTMTGQLHESFTQIEQTNTKLKEEHDRFISIMDAMNSLVYVTDPDTYELLFINQYGRRIWGDRIGEKCWEVLQTGQDSPCTFCQRDQKNQKGVSAWEYQNTVNQEWYQCSDQHLKWPGGRIVNLQVATNITKIKKAEKEHLSHLHFLKTMDRIDRVIRKATDAHQMLEDLLETVFSIFDCDRACLIYPCDPGTKTFKIPMAKTRSSFPIPIDLNQNQPMIESLARAFENALASQSPVTCQKESKTAFFDLSDQHFGIHSQISMALHPKTNKPWLFDMHKCSGKHVWTQEDIRLFEEIGRRIADGLSNMSVLQSLQESEERYRQIIEGTDNLVTEVDKEGKFIFVNETGIKIFGIPAEKCVGMPAFEFIHPDDREKTLNQFNQVLEKKAAVMTFENRQVSTSGEIREMLWTSNFYYDETGSLSSVKGIARDITQRKQIEKEMIRLQNLLSNILNSMPSVLVGVDQQARVIQWNREAERATGVTARDARGQNLVNVFPRLEPQIKMVHQAVLTQTPQKDINIAAHENGETTFSDVTVYPLIADSIEGAVIRVDDVTEKMRMEEMMIQNEKMLSVGGLAAGMAHEINNPLAGMIQTANVMKSRLKNIKMPANLRVAADIGLDLKDISTFMEKRGILRMADAINESGQRMAELVENMLSFARKSEAMVSSHDLVQLMEQILDLAATDYDLKKQYDFKTIEIKKEYQDNLPMVDCEGGKIQQVLLNLLRNGAQAMLMENKDKSIQPVFTLRIYMEHKTEMLKIEIQDNGPGMDQATCKRIFEPFFTTKPVGIGTGLGLSVSYFIIVENHGGTMDVMSEPGKGTNFIIGLPLGKKI